MRMLLLEVPSQALEPETEQDTWPILVCDGSVMNEQGTFGWVISLSTGEKLCTGKGPAYGHDISSYRAEAYRMLSGLLYLHHLLSFYSTEEGTSWPYRNFVVYCDNKSLVQVVSAKVKTTCQEYVNETMESEWDVVQAIVQCIKQLGTIDLRHVKGHQTEKSADQPLTLSAKLNNEADAIATTFQEHTNHKDDLVIPIAGSQAYLHADAVFPIMTSDGADDNFLPRRTITRGVRKFVRDVYGTRRICEHIQDKEGWTDDVFHSVDWTSFSSARANTKESRTFIIKLINNYLPVGKRVWLYKPYYEAQCPSCDTPRGS
jgi:ribonuclease HI